MDRWPSNVSSPKSIYTVGSQILQGITDSMDSVDCSEKGGGGGEKVIASLVGMQVGVPGRHL